MKEFKKGQTVYFTKYALTKGIQKKTVRDDSSEGTMFFVNEGYVLVRDIDVFHTMDEAVIKAEGMLEVRILSLKNQIVKLKRMSFSK